MDEVLQFDWSELDTVIQLTKLSSAAYCYIYNASWPKCKYRWRLVSSAEGGTEQMGVGCG